MKRKELVESIRLQYPTDHTIYLKFDACRIRVDANEKDIIDELGGYFEPFVVSETRFDISITVHQGLPPAFSVDFDIKTPDPGKTKIKEEFAVITGGRIVRKRLTGMVFIFGEGDHLAVGPCLDNMNQVINFINNRYIEWKLCSGCLLGHAAGVIRNGRGLALAGFSGAGKSTLALHLMSHDSGFISNDRLMIEKKGTRIFMHGVGKLPRINPGTALNNPDLKNVMSSTDRERFSRLSPEELWDIEHKYDVHIEDCFGPDRFILSAPMDGLVILNWKQTDEETTVKRVDLNERRDLLPAFMKSTGLFFLPDRHCRMPEPTEDNYIDFLSGSRVIEFSGGVNFDKAIAGCLAFLDTGRLNA